MDLLFYAIAFVLILSVIVFVHELGHFIAAKRFGVYCGEFSIGMGPVLFKIQGKETQYSIRALPIGGFVSMAGEADDTKKDVEVPFERTINGIKAWQKIVVMLAGIFMNVILAWALFIGLNMYQGSVSVPADPVFYTVEKGSVADVAGFQDGDRVLSITEEDGKVLVPESFDEMRELINLSPQTFVFEIQRGDTQLSLDITPEADENGVYRIGVTQLAKREKIAWYEAFKYGTEDMVDNSTLIFKSLGKLVQGENLKQLSGPVGIFKITGTAVDAGWITILHLLALLSLNIGIFNAIPIPILDGGRVVITLIEKAMGREINEKILNFSMYAGAFLMIGLMVFATFNDVLKLF